MTVVAVVIPVFNGAPFLRLLLPVLNQSSDRPEVVVVDDGSDDETADVAQSLGAEVIRLPKSVGPAQARNLGVERTNAEVVLFVDADCIPHPDVLDRVRQAFEEDQDLVSLTGSYDSQPLAGGFFSQYMNLRHHIVHQGARQESATFWTGCGAVRRKAFLEVGGFDSERYPHPQIEDIELGRRLQRLGKTRLDPQLQVTHLKHWTLRSVMATDIFRRGIPWARLIFETSELPDDLNLRRSQRLAALLSPAALASVFALPWALWTGSWFVVAGALAFLGISVVLNANLLRAFTRLRGPGFAARAGLFHQLHLFYSGATFTLCMLAFFTAPRASNSGRRRQLDPEVEQQLRSTFARYDPVALGAAIGTATALGLACTTSILLLKGGIRVGPNLSLLGNYFFGFSVSWPGVLVGLLEGAFGGFLFGALLATVLNVMIGVTDSVLRRQLQEVESWSDELGFEEAL